MKIIEESDLRSVFGGVDDPLGPYASGFEGTAALATGGFSLRLAVGAAATNGGVASTASVTAVGVSVTSVAACTAAFACGFMIGDCIEREWKVGTNVGTYVGNFLGDMGYSW